MVVTVRARGIDVRGYRPCRPRERLEPRCVCSRTERERSTIHERQHRRAPMGWHDQPLRHVRGRPFFKRAPPRFKRELCNSRASDFALSTAVPLPGDQRARDAGDDDHEGHAAREPRGEACRAKGFEGHGPRRRSSNAPTLYFLPSGPVAYFMYVTAQGVELNSTPTQRHRL
jgi:hypothetical protein